MRRSTINIALINDMDLVYYYSHHQTLAKECNGTLLYAPYYLRESQ
jgi:hypothetical protein